MRQIHATVRDFRWLILLASLSLIATGCSDNGLEMIPVSGTVTFDGGECPAEGSLYFIPVEPPPGIPMRPGTGDFDRDGAYAVKSFKPGDGLLPGKYQVRIECWEVPPNMEGRPVKSFIPQRYHVAEESGFELDVPSGSGAITFDVPLTSEP